MTGAGAGLGRAEALALARAGADVVVNDLAESDVVDEIEALGAKAIFVAGDVSERATADALVAAATEHFGGLHIVVNNAGVTRDRMLFNMTDDEWDTVIGVHLRGHFLLSRNAAAYWRAQVKAGGEPVYARVINTSSEAGLTGSEGQANYSAAKAGITALTLATARGLARLGRAGERDLPARSYGDDRARCSVQLRSTASTRCRSSMSRRSSPTSPRRPPDRSAARCSSSTAAWSR